MSLQRTLSMIKPDAVSANKIGEICARIEKSGLKIAAASFRQLTPREAEGFYAVHRERPFFAGLVEFMCSGPVMILVLEGEEAVVRYRTLMGATNPEQAAAGTLRAEFATSLRENAVHGSDSIDNAAIEIAYFFPALAIVSRHENQSA